MRRKKEALILFEILLVILVCVALAGFVQAGTKTLTFAWEQAAADTSAPDFGGWKIYRKLTADGTPAYALVATIDFVAAQATYTTSQTLEFPSGQTTTAVFVATAFDKAGNESAYSNEATVIIDFQAPSVPIQFRITVVPAAN
jgi:hypothetical protein